MVNHFLVKDIRKEVKKFIYQADDKTIRMIYAMLEIEQNESVWTNDFLSEMDRRTKDFESGNAKLITLDELQQKARKTHKQRK